MAVAYRIPTVKRFTYETFAKFQFFFGTTLYIPAWHVESVPAVGNACC